MRMATGILRLLALNAKGQTGSMLRSYLGIAQTRKQNLLCRCRSLYTGVDNNATIEEATKVGNVNTLNEIDVLLKNLKNDLRSNDVETSWKSYLTIMRYGSQSTKVTLSREDHVEMLLKVNITKLKERNHRIDIEYEERLEYILQNISDLESLTSDTYTKSLLKDSVFGIKSNKFEKNSNTSISGGKSGDEIFGITLSEIKTISRQKEHLTGIYEPRIISHMLYFYSLIRAYEKADHFWNSIKNHGGHIDRFSYIIYESILAHRALSGSISFFDGKIVKSNDFSKRIAKLFEIWNEMESKGISKTPRVVAHMIFAYGVIGNVNVAQKLFDNSQRPSPVNGISIGEVNRKEDGILNLSSLRDAFTKKNGFGKFFNGNSDAKNVEENPWISLEESNEVKLDFSKFSNSGRAEIYASLIKVYLLNGNVDKAIEIFNSMDTLDDSKHLAKLGVINPRSHLVLPNVTTFNSLIKYLVLLRRYDLALDYVDLMITEKYNILPNHSTMTCLITRDFASSNYTIAENIASWISDIAGIERPREVEENLRLGYVAWRRRVDAEARYSAPTIDDTQLTPDIPIVNLTD